VAQRRHRDLGPPHPFFRLGLPAVQVVAERQEGTPLAFHATVVMVPDLFEPMGAELRDGPFLRVAGARADVQHFGRHGRDAEQAVAAAGEPVGQSLDDRVPDRAGRRREPGVPVVPSQRPHDWSSCGMVRVVVTLRGGVVRWCV
jgi:hypothetical protein